MNEEEFIKAIRYLELGYVIQSSFSDTTIKKEDGNYYSCFEICNGKYSNWILCQDDSQLFRVAEIKNTWYILDKSDI